MEAIKGALRPPMGEGHSLQVQQLSVYLKGVAIPLDAQSLWPVEQGVVKLSCLDMGGTEKILGIAAPGQLRHRLGELLQELTLEQLQSLCGWTFITSALSKILS